MWMQRLLPQTESHAIIGTGLKFIQSFMKPTGRDLVESTGSLR